MNKTGIEWCTYTWNCLRGCSWMSPGCDHCYAEQIARRFGHAGQAYEGAYDYEADSWSGQVFFFEHKLDEPQRVKAPQIVFANSMSDVCHPEVKPEWLDAIFYHMTAAERHWYMVLTKRPHLIAKKFWTEARADGEPRYYTPYSLPGRLAMGISIESEGHLFRGHRLLQNWPGRAFLSMEPILSRVSIKSILRADQAGRIKQIIVGGESGKGCRPMEIDWVRQLRDETKEAGRAFFFKQYGEDLFTAKHLRELGRELDGREWNESPWPVPLPINLAQAS